MVISNYYFTPQNINMPTNCGHNGVSKIGPMLKLTSNMQLVITLSYVALL